MIIKRFDQYFIVLLLLVAMFSSYKLFFDNFQTNLLKNDILIATITEHLNTVKLKRFGNMAWIDASLNDRLTYNDQIYTHEGSSTQLSLVDNSVVDVSEKTLFKIGKSDKNTEFFLEQGIIHTRFNAQSGSNIKLHLNKQTIELNSKNAVVSIIQNKEQTKISVLEGTAQINEKGVVTTIDYNQFVRLNKTSNILEVGKDKISLISPVHNQTEYISHPRDILFSYQPLHDQNPNFVIEIASDPEFKNIYKSLKTIKHSINIQFADEGIYYWRVKTDNTNDYPIGQFKLIKIKPPQIFAPEVNEEFVFEKVTKNINNKIQIMFENTQKNAEVELFLPDNKKQLISSTDSILDLPVESMGEYSFRIRNLLIDGQKSPWSSLHKFKVTQAFLPFAPDTIIPNHDHEFIFYNKEKMIIDLKWISPEAIPTSYNLIIQNLKDQVEVENTVLTQNFFRKKINSPGKYSWKVKMIDKWLRVGPYSNAANFTVTLMEIKNTLPQDGVVLKLARPDQKVNFEWEKKSVEDLSVFEVSKEQDFNNIIHEEKTNKNKINVVFKEIGTYYWRIKNQEKTSNTSHYAEPIRVIIEPIAPPEKPILPKFQELKIQKKQTSWIESLFNILIPSAYANDYYTRIKWPAKENIKSYKLEIYQDETAANLLIAKTVATPYFDWDNPPMGTFYWRMAYIDFWDRTSEFSDLSTIQIDIDSNLKISNEISLLSPRHLDEDVFSKNKKVQFAWEKQENITEYELIFSDDLEFTQIFLTLKTKTNSINLEHAQLKKGQFFWKITGLGPYNTNTSSKRRSFRLLAPSPVVVTNLKTSKTTTPSFKTLGSYLIAGYAPSKDHYEIKSTSLTSNIDDSTIMSFFSKGVFKFNNKFKLNYSLFFKKGKVYGDQNWQIFDLLPSLDYSLHSLWVGVGVSLNQTGVYPYTPGNSKPTYVGKTYLSPLITLKYPMVLTENLKLILESKKGFGGTSLFLFDSSLLWNYTKQSLLSLGLNYSKKSFDYETQEIGFSELKVLLGLGFVF